jgi:AbiTii
VSKREQAAIVAEELLREIELGEVAPTAIARKTARLARLLDDVDAMQWLEYEVAGYPTPLDAASTAAAERSNRWTTRDDGTTAYWTANLGELEALVEANKAAIAAESGAPSGGQWDLVVSRESAGRRNSLIKNSMQAKATLDRVVGALYQYAAAKHQGLRFGSAAESAFEVVRSGVDSAIGELVPEALPMISGAFENASSDNPEHWANAASTCRRLLKAVADRLRPPGPDVVLESGQTVQMGEGSYINRLGDWMRIASSSETSSKVFLAELAYLEAQLKAADQAGQKGAHETTVTRLDAARYVAGTYLILGDLLRLGGLAAAPPAAEHETLADLNPGEPTPVDRSPPVADG